MFSEADTDAVNARLDELLHITDRNAIIDAHYYCPHHPQAPIERYRQDCACRKPRPGMLLDAARDLDLDLTRSWMVGDAPRDIAAGAAAGCRTILYSDPSLPASAAAAEPGSAIPDFTARSLDQVAQYIERAGQTQRKALSP